MESAAAHQAKQTKPELTSKVDVKTGEENESNIFQVRFCIAIRVPTAQGKEGMWPTKFAVRENTWNLEMLSKHREFCQNTGNTQGILLAQVENTLIQKVKDIAIFAAKKSIFFQKLDRSAKCI